MKSSLLLCLVAALLLTGTALAQSSAGTITGRIVDPTGQAVAAATVTLTKPDTGETRTFTANSSGEFTFTSLQPGVYDLAVKASGFKAFDKKGLALSASEHL